MPPTFTNGWAQRVPWVEKTANNKLTKLYWPSRKRSPKRLIVLLRAKKWRGTTQKIFSGASRRIGAPHFQIRSGATDANQNDLDGTV